MYNEKYYTSYVEKLKDVECEEEVRIFPIQGSGQTLKH